MIEMLIDFGIFITLILTQTKKHREDNFSTKKLPFATLNFLFPLQKTHLFTSGRRAIDINLISKLLFKSKQMDFIVKIYWQYVYAL